MRKDLVRGAQKLDCPAPGSGFQRKQAQFAEKRVMLQGSGVHGTIVRGGGKKVPRN